MMVVMTDKQPSKRKGRQAIMKPEFSIEEQIRFAQELAAALQDMAATNCDSEIQDFFATQKAVRSVNNELEKLRLKKEKALQEASQARISLARRLKDFHEKGIPTRSISDHFKIEQTLVETLLRAKTDDEDLDNSETVNIENISSVNFLSEVTTENVAVGEYYG